LFFREIKTLTGLTVLINNIYNVEFLEYDVSKVNPSSIIIKQLSIIEFLFTELYVQYLYEHVRVHLCVTCARVSHMCARECRNSVHSFRRMKYDHSYCMDGRMHT